jgi:hypothetical protein
MFNPLAWGILFFSFWLSLRTIGEIGAVQQGFAWFFLGLAGMLWLSIAIPPLGKSLANPNRTKLLVPIIFFVSMFAYMINLLNSIKYIEGPTLQIAMIFGFLWIVAYLVVLIRNVERNVGISISLSLIGLAVYYFSRPPTAEPLLSAIILLALGIVLLVTTIKKPAIYQRFPF